MLQRTSSSSSQNNNTYAPCSWKFWETGLSATQHLQYLESSRWSLFCFVKCVDKGLLAELVLLRLPWDLLVLVLEDSSVVRHLSISEGVQCCWIIPRVMIDLSLIHGDISAILLSQEAEWSAINMVFSSQLQLMILDRENTAKYFTADFAKH